MWISASSTNAYLIHARADATGWVNVQNFTKVFTDAIENGSREVLLSEIEDVSKFDDNYWYKENGKLIWKGFALETVAWVKGEETTTETVSKDGWIMYTPSSRYRILFHWLLRSPLTFLWGTNVKISTARI